MGGSVSEAAQPPPKHYLEGTLQAVDGDLRRIDASLVTLFGRTTLDDSLDQAVSTRLRQKIGALRHLRNDLTEIPGLRNGQGREGSH
jgi:hypothetical protein